MLAKRESITTFINEQYAVFINLLSFYFIKYLLLKNIFLVLTFIENNILFSLFFLFQGGYRTHWTTPEEATEEMERLGLLIVEIKEQEKGVLVAFRKKH